jgi:hypothetical protein
VAEAGEDATAPVTDVAESADPVADAAASDPAAATASQDATSEAAGTEDAGTQASTEDTAATETATTEPAVSEDTAATDPAPAAPVGTPAANQVGFAVWDAVLPFTSDDRIVGGKPTPIVLRLSPDVDLAEAGDWLEQGLLINSVNGTPTPTSGALTAAILNAMEVYPDGKARVVVEYLGSDLQPRTGLLTVHTVRLASLTNGVSVRSLVVDGAWRTEVTGVAQPELTGLRQGDILFRDKTTGTPLDSATALETIMAELVAQSVTQTEFSIIRDNKVSAATMQLMLEEGQ